jgi:hypothetical protein
MFHKLMQDIELIFNQNIETINKKISNDFHIPLEELQLFYQNFKHNQNNLINTITNNTNNTNNIEKETYDINEITNELNNLNLNNNYETKTLKELKEIAKERKIKNYFKLKKQELIDQLIK